MSDDAHGRLSPHEVAMRFDLLAADAMEYALFLLEEDGRLICWNPGAERMFGYAPQEVLGQHYSRFFSPEDIRNGQPEYELKMALTDGDCHAERWQVRKDGSRFWCRATTTPLRDEHKQFRSFARVMHDLTEGEAETAQKNRADTLESANRAKEEFMALLSHELRSPLSPILNAVSVLRRMKTDDPLVAQAGGVIDRQVAQMVRLIDDLLDISRITKGKLRLVKEPIDLRVIVNRAAETCHPFMDARNHDFSVSLPTNSLWVDADPARMEQVVVNLLNNAAKYTEPSGLVRMTVSREGDDAVVRVRDNGVGIAPELLANVFELFTQVDGSLGRSYGGLGIGLALASDLVEMHDGRLQAASDGLGKGCEFTIKLPAIAEPVERKSPTPRNARGEVRRSLQILLVEDNVDSADTLSLLLRLHGHEVQIARTGPTALEVAKDSQFDVVLLDIGLPGMDGYQVAERLRESPNFAGVMICALTGYTPSDADRERQRQTGFDHHFVKPVRIETLLELFESVARREPHNRG